MNKTSTKDPTGVFLLALCMFTTGGAGLVNEYVLATTTSYLLGNSIHQFSLIIGLMVCMMGVASVLQQYVSDHRLIEKFVVIEVLMALIGGFAPTFLYGAYAFTPHHFKLALYVLVSLIGFLIGFEIPLVMRIIQQKGVKLATNLSWVYGADYIGSFVCSLIWLELLQRYPITEISFMLAGINFLVAAVTVAYFSRHRLITHRRMVLAVTSFTFCVLLYGYWHNRNWSASLQQYLFKDPIVLQTQTQYQFLVITHNKRLNDTRLYINGHTQFSSVDEERYHENLVHPVMALVGDHDHILVLGGGDGLALRELLKYDDVKSVTLVDLDPQMVQLARSHKVLRQLNQDAFADARVVVKQTKAVTAGGSLSVYFPGQAVDQAGNRVREHVADVQVRNVDADRFLADIAGSYNVIIVDLPDPNSVELNKLYTKEFYAKLSRHLAEHGMVAIQSTSPYHARESFLEIGRTMRAAGLATMPYHDNIPSFGEWGWHLAWKSPQNNATLRQRINNIEQFDVTTNYLTPDHFRSNLSFGRKELQTERNLVNTMIKPTLLWIYQHEVLNNYR